MKQRFASYLTILVVMAVTISGAFLRPALAATSSIDSSINSIENKVGRLMDIRGDQSISSDTKTTKEIAAQKDILNEIVTLSANEISTLQTKLNSLPDFDKDSKGYSLKSNYLAELSSYNEYFTQESAVISSAVTLSQLQTVAVSIKTFRDAGYNSEIYDMVTFTLLYYDAGIISTANNRLNSISSDLTNLENAQLLLNSSVLDDDISQAANLIDKASSLHGQASGLILWVSPENSTSTTASSTTDSELTPTASSTATSTPAVDTPDPRDLIEKSISDIKSAYQIFIEVVNNIKTQLDL
jgi:hypothetical protein